TAPTFTPAAAFDGRYLYMTTFVAGQTYNWSVFIKLLSGSGLIFFGVENPAGSLYFNPVSGTITSPGNALTATSVVSVGNGWWRVSGTLVMTSNSENFTIRS